ncbi:MAG: DUF3568 family protein [Phycisphaerales bacterium]|nr:DUF3568 family protein [Phycisphaerales bacterium]
MHDARRRQTYLTLAPLALCAVGLTSCAGGLEFAAVGAAFQGTNFATAVYKQGRLSVVEEAEYALVEQAALKAIDQLGLTRRREDTENDDPSVDRRTIYVEDDDGHDLAISTRRLTERMTLLQVDVGSFGMEELVRAVMLRIRTNLFQEIKAMQDASPSPDKKSESDSDAHDQPPPIGLTIPREAQE